MGGIRRKRADLDAVLLMEDVLALLGVSESYLLQLRNEGFVSSPYTYRTVVQGYIRKLREDRRTTKTSKADAVTKERARKLKMENDERAGILVEFEKMLALVEATFGEVRADLGSIPTRITDDLELRRRWEDELNLVLRALATRFRESSDAVRSGRDPSDASDEDEAEQLGEE